MSGSVAGGADQGWPETSGTAALGVPSGHTIQRVLGVWTASAMSFVASGITLGIPLGVKIHSDLFLIGEVGGPRTIVTDAGYAVPTYVIQPTSAPSDPYFAAYTGWRGSFDVQLRAANPSVNQQPLDLIWAWSLGSVQGGVGVIGAELPGVEMELLWTLLTTTPRST